MNSTDTLPYLLINTAKCLKAYIKAESEGENTQDVPFELLGHLNDEGLSMKALAERMHCSKQEVTRQVQRAEQHGWVEVKPDPNDGRVKRVHYAKKGQELIAGGRRYYQSLEAQWREELGSEEVDALLRALKRLRPLLLNRS